MKKFGIILVTLIVVMGILLGWVSANKNKFIQKQIEKGLAATLSAQSISDTTFEVLFCGTGSPQYHKDRSQPCTAVIAGGRLFLFDAGQGSSLKLADMNAPTIHLDTIFITHLHSHHISGVGDVLHSGWLWGRTEPVQIVGPSGVQPLARGVDLVFQHDLVERKKVLGKSGEERTIVLGTAKQVMPGLNDMRTVYDQNGVVIKAFNVDHPEWEIALGYRVDFGGKSIVISGDTRKTQSIIEASRGVDLLIHEAMNAEFMDLIEATIRRSTNSPVSADRLPRIKSTHTGTLELAESAKEANVKTLVMTHLIPPIPANNIAESTFSDGVDDIFSGEVIIARDGMRITLID